MEKLNVLLLKDKYNGAYNSFEQFYENIEYMFQKNGDSVFVAYSVQEAYKLIRDKKISFTINVGQYNFLLNGKPLYDILKVMNYQWIIDNPLRYPKLDYISAYNRFIMIDLRFCDYIAGISKKSINLPIPFFYVGSSNTKIDAIFAPLKIKEKSQVLANILDEKELILVNDFITHYNYNESFHANFSEFIKNNEIENLSHFFEMTNGYIRVEKRIRLLNSIRNKRIIVASNRPNDVTFNDNIIFIDPLDYTEVMNEIGKYKYVLNCNPNFDYCLHDRISYSICRDTVIISDKNELLDELDFPLSFQYDKFFEIDYILDNISIGEYYRILEKQKQCIAKYSMENIVEKIIEDFSLYGNII